MKDLLPFFHLILLLKSSYAYKPTYARFVMFDIITVLIDQTLWFSFLSQLCLHSRLYGLVNQLFSEIPARFRSCLWQDCCRFGDSEGWFSWKAEVKRKISAQHVFFRFEIYDYSLYCGDLHYLDRTMRVIFPSLRVEICWPLVLSTWQKGLDDHLFPFLFILFCFFVFFHFRGDFKQSQVSHGMVSCCLFDLWIYTGISNSR